MKKIAFALQVFTVIAVLPLYVIMELNHTKVAPTENNIYKSQGKIKTTPANAKWNS